MCTIIMMFSALSIAAQDLKVMDYKQFKSEYLKDQGELVIYNFWATWCKPCVKELPYFIELAEKQDIRLVLVSLDFPKQIDSKLKPFLSKNNIKNEVVLLDESNANVFIDDIEPKWQGSIPATLLWKGKKLAFAEKEFHSFVELEDFINPFKQSK